MSYRTGTILASFVWPRGVADVAPENVRFAPSFYRCSLMLLDSIDLLDGVVSRAVEWRWNVSVARGIGSCTGIGLACLVTRKILLTAVASSRRSAISFRVRVLAPQIVQRVVLYALSSSIAVLSSFF
jgi:hypothetical protein